MSVHRGVSGPRGPVLGGCLVPGGVPAPGWSAPGGVPGGDHPRTATATGGTHPTGMHSCLSRVISRTTSQHYR